MRQVRKTAIILESLVCFGPVALLLPWAVFLRVLQAVAEVPSGSTGDAIRSRLAGDPAIVQVRVSYEGANIPAREPFFYWSVPYEHASCVRKSFEKATDRLIRCKMIGKAGTRDVLNVKTELRQVGNRKTQVELELDYDLIEQGLRSK